MKHFFWLWTAQCFLIGGGTLASGPERSPVQVSAILGEEVTFPVRIRDGFEIEDILCVFKGANIAKMTPGNNYTVRDERFLGRLYAMDDNGSLNIRNLRTEDAGLYTIEIFNKINSAKKETKRYELEIFRRVKAQIIPITTLDSANGRCLISFNCTVNDNTYVSYSWNGEKVGPSVEPVLSLNLTESESNLTVCCTVKNPVSEASACVLPREICFPDGGGPSDESGGSSVDTVAIAVAVSCSCAACAAVIVILYKNMSAKGSKNQAQGDNPTVYAQINNVNNGTQGGNHYTRTEEKNPKLKTIYADVQHTQQMEEAILPNGNHPAPEANVTTTYAQLQKPKTKKDKTSESLLGSGLDSGSPYDQVI